MKITILTPLYWPSIGGVQTSMRLTGAYLARQGHEVTVLASQMNNADEAEVRNFRRSSRFPESEKKDGVSIRRFPTGGPIDLALGVLFSAAYRFRLPFWPLLYSAYRRRRFRASSMLRFLRAHPPDLLMLAPLTDESTRLGLEAARLTGAKLVMVTSLHVSSLDPAFAPKQLALLNGFDAVITNTPFERDFLIKEGVSAERTHVSGVPVDLEAMKSASPAVSEERLLALEKKKYVLYLGRKDKGKGLTALVDIFNKPPEKLRDTVLVLAGVSSGYFEKKVRPRIQNHSAIVVADTVDEAAKWWLLKHAAVYCMVSSVDSFGITYLEAWLSGLPVVAADLPAMRCVVRHGEDGLLAPYADRALIGEALCRLVSDGQNARQMGEKGRQKVLLERGDFAVEKKVEKILEGLFPAAQARQTERARP